MATVSLTGQDKYQVQSQPYGLQVQFQIGTFNCDNVYPKGGWPVSASQWGVNAVIGLMQVGTSGTEGATFKYDALNATIKAYTAVTGTANGIELAEIPASATCASMAPQFLMVGW